MEQLSAEKKWDVAERCVHTNLKRTVRAVTRQFDDALAAVELHVTQFTLLVTSSLLGPAPLTELAERLAMDRTTLTRNLRPLERRGLIETVADVTDQRVRVVRITPEGETMIARAYPLWRRAQEEVTGKLEGPRYDVLLTDLERLREVPS